MARLLDEGKGVLGAAYPLVALEHGQLEIDVLVIAPVGGPGQDLRDAGRAGVDEDLAPQGDQAFPARGDERRRALGQDRRRLSGYVKSFRQDIRIDGLPIVAVMMDPAVIPADRDEVEGGSVHRVEGLLIGAAAGARQAQVRHDGRIQVLLEIVPEVGRVIDAAELDALADADAIQGEGGYGLLQGMEGMMGVIGRPDEPFFFAGPEGEDDRPFGLESGRLHQPGHLHDDDRPGGVVVGAVHHPAVRPHAQAVHMGADDDSFLFQPAVPPSDPAEDVDAGPSLDDLRLDVQGGPDAHGEGRRLSSVLERAS